MAQEYKTSIVCPVCGGRSLSTEIIPIGQHVRCPHCQSTFPHMGRQRNTTTDDSDEQGGTGIIHVLQVISVIIGIVASIVLLWWVLFGSSTVITTEMHGNTIEVKEKTNWNPF